jgi:hypothetical protein
MSSLGSGDSTLFPLDDEDDELSLFFCFGGLGILGIRNFR